MSKLEKIKNISNKILNDDNGNSIYDGFDEKKYGNTLEPGSAPAPYFYNWIVEQTSNRLNGGPILGIEVGSFLGYSAIGFAKKMKELNPNSKLICIDTWLGSAEHYDKESGNRDTRLGTINGYPTMYHKFLANVIYNDVQDIIIPLPVPSATGYKILKKFFESDDISADFAYIDGSHEENEVYMDLYNYYHLIDSESYLCGDDWAWESVKNDVTKFCVDNQLTLSLLENKIHWVIKK